MTYTQEQTREIVGLSVETLRHWRSVISYLRPKIGKGARFTFSDVIGLAFVREITSVGVAISGISDGVDELFRILSKTFWQSLNGTFIVVSRSNAFIVDNVDVFEVSKKTASIIIPCDPVLARIQDALFPTTEVPPQRMLPFPPKVLKGQQ